jgi:hypothetical protein
VTGQKPEVFSFSFNYLPEESRRRLVRENPLLATVRVYRKPSQNLPERHLAEESRKEGI